jgi:hypothetical protein
MRLIIGFVLGLFSSALLAAQPTVLLDTFGRPVDWKTIVTSEGIANSGGRDAKGIWRAIRVDATGAVICSKEKP